MLAGLCGWVGVACAPKQYVDPAQAETVRYRLDVRGVFATSASGPPAALDALAAVGTTSLDMHLELSVQVARAFRDGSLGTLVRFERAWFEHLEGGVSVLVEDPAALQGRSVELRSFPGDEILTVDLVEHVAGADRYVDVFDLVFPVLAPYPPSLDEGARAQELVRWPTVVADGRAARNTVRATWHNRGLGAARGEPAWELAYTGPWEVLGRDGLVVQGNLVRGEGQVAGTTWYRASDAELVVHEFSWNRTLTARYPGADATPEGGVEVQQRQAFTGRLERVSP